jgi:hypothetical protein
MTADHRGRARADGPDHPGGEHEQAAEMQEMMREQHERWLWRDWTSIVLGLWLATSPVTLGYRSAAMTWNDVIAGTAIVVFGVISLSPRRELARWGICAVGIWLLFAPLVFWAPDASAYLNDTIVGAFAIAFGVLVPMMPGKAHHMVMMAPGPDLPPGWSYNPSTWLQRAPPIALAFFAFFAARYLAAYQLGYIGRVWDPFFSDGTRRVLESEVSRAWPISDAGLGALSYLLEALSGLMGGVRRWRTMPWMVAMFGVLVVPLGVTSIVLVILQPVTVGAWCTLCLFTAALMLLMIPFAVDEVVAMGQFLARSRREGKPFWRTFWVGGTLDERAADERSPALTAPLSQTLPATVWGVSVRWTLLSSAVIGLWLMFAPSVFNTSGAAADSTHLVGALVVTVAVTALAEVLRGARYLTVLLGGWIALAPWVLAGASPAARWHDLAVGALLVLLSLPRGRVQERYGNWDHYIR